MFLYKLCGNHKTMLVADYYLDGIEWYKVVGDMPIEYSPDPYKVYSVTINEQEFFVKFYKEGWVECAEDVTRARKEQPDILKNFHITYLQVQKIEDKTR